MNRRYRTIRWRIIPGKTCLLIWFKWMGFCGCLIAISVLLLLWLRAERLSRFKDLAETRFDDLNKELQRLPLVKESQDSWRKPRVEGTRILSAYFDTRPEVILEEDPNLIQDDSTWAMIRIIAIVPVKMASASLVCHYRYVNKDLPEKTYTLRKKTIGIRLAAFEENFGMFYCAAFILCELPGRLTASRDIFLPYEVTVSSEISGNDYTDLRDEEFVVVRYPRNGWSNSSIVGNEEKKQTIAVCIQPLHHQFDRTLDLVSFVEFYRMMGVDRFTFYRDSVSSRVNEILEYYAVNGVATVIEWRLPNSMYLYEQTLRVDGIFAALNDCLYRNTFHASYRYTAGVDIDEYIVPREHENLQQMMEYLNPTTNHVAPSDAPNGAWIFRNMFFYLMHQDDEITLRPGLPKMKVHSKTTRWLETNRFGDRSKYIVQGRDVVDLGNHRVWKMKKSRSIFGTRYGQIAVDPRIAGSQHYRKCETVVETCWLRPTVLDRTAHRFTAQLGERVVDVLNATFPSWEFLLIE